jgi:hypothetical protein
LADAKTLTAPTFSRISALDRLGDFSFRLAGSEGDFDPESGRGRFYGGHGPD